MRVKEIRMLTVNIVALIFANIGEPREWNREFKISVIEEGNILITVNSIVVSDSSSQIDKAGGSVA
jgi:hypothetical protein